MTARAFDRVATEREEKRCSPSIERCEEASLFFFNERTKIMGIFVLFSIKSIVTDHFKMFLGDMDNELFDEIPSGNSFGNEFVIFMSVVMKSDEITIIIVNTGRSNNRSAEIATNIVKDRIVVCQSRFSIYIKAVFLIFVDGGFDFFEGRADFLFQEIKQKHLKRIP